MTYKYPTLLFDLDGTLTDPFPGITRSIQYALEKLGLSDIPSAEDLSWCIGPPLPVSFAQLLNTEDEALLDQAVQAYRERYTVTGLFENEVIDGIVSVLDAFQAEGRKMFVATSKPHVYAARIISHFGLDGYFGKTYGSELDGTNSAKTELIAHILREEDLTSEDCVMIGDRKHDLIGAAGNQMASIGVMWGYGSRDELSAETPLGIADKPQDLISLIGQ